MRRPPIAHCLLVAGLVVTATARGWGAESESAESLKLTLPQRIDAVAGVPLSVYFDNIVLTRSVEEYRFRVQCDIGMTEHRRWTVVPSKDAIGRHPWTVEVYDREGELLAKASTTLLVVAGDAGDERKVVTLLLVGDSLTHATIYPNELARLLSEPGNPAWTMLGTHRPATAGPGVAHEGYGGWTWQRFAEHYEPDPDGTYRKRSSPFVRLDARGVPTLDVAGYLGDHAAAAPPDFVLFLLGINDCFSADPEDSHAIDDRIDAMLAQADTLLAAFRDAAPQARLGVAVTTPPNARQAAFTANYQDRYSRWGWKRIQHRLVQRLLRHFETKPREHVFVIPTHLNLDPIDGYPENNGVHPNQVGYRQIAASLYAALKVQLTSDPRPAPE